MSELKTQVDRLITLLTEVRGIIVGAGETYFSELKRRDRVRIFNMVDESETLFADGDGDGCSAALDREHYAPEIVDSGFDIVFFDHSYDCVTKPDSFYVGLHQKPNTVHSIDDGITFLRSLVNNRPPLALLNTAILTADGDFTLRTISVEEARQLVGEANGLDSAIGHESTAQIMTTVLGVDVPVNRQQFAQQAGQQALVFKLNGRPAEGAILTAAEVEAIGYRFQLLTRL